MSYGGGGGYRGGGGGGGGYSGGSGGGGGGYGGDPEPKGDPEPCSKASCGEGNDCTNRRVYIENMPPGIKVDEIVEVFSGIGKLTRERPKGRGVFKDQMYVYGWNNKKIKKIIILTEIYILWTRAERRSVFIIALSLPKKSTMCISTTTWRARLGKVWHAAVNQHWPPSRLCVNVLRTTLC